MMFLNQDLNPDNFIKDLDYLSGIHSKHLSEFIKKKFSKNANNMEPKKVDLTKLYIGNQSNIYSNEVNYGVDIASEEFSYLRQKKNEQSKLEKYLNLNKQALLWTYVRKNKLMFKALHCSEYYIDTDNFGELESVIIKTGSYYDELGVLQYKFLGYKDGKIYSKTAISWLFLGEMEKGDDGIEKLTNKIKIENWFFDNTNPDEFTYQILPFNLISYDNIITPARSDLIDLENMLSGGYSYGEMTILISFLKKFLVTSGMSQASFEEFAAKFGINFSLGLIPNESDVKFLDTGTVDNQLNYQLFMSVILYFRANADGVDRYAIFPDVKVESGISRELQMKNIEQIRNMNIPIWENFEHKNFELIASIKNKGGSQAFQVPTSVTYQKNITSSEAENLERQIKEYDLNQKKYIDGVITKVELIMRSEKISEEDAEKKINEVQKEREENATETEPIVDVPNANDNNADDNTDNIVE